ncbi:MAG: hypothetical protein LC650_01605 [Actinobacteria bacterium]|nr:hypothetical protein [Actinomycetota bacterium]
MTLTNYQEQSLNSYTPAKWWRVTAPDGSLWCETSSEEEAREAVREGDTLEQLWTRTQYVWQTTS